jgi:hypothetical protein
MSSSVRSIGTRVFVNCSKLSSITIPSSVTSIGTNAFSSCTSLTSVTIPSNVTNIGHQAFSGCSGLKAVYFQGDAPSGDSTVFGYGTVYYLPGTSGWGPTFGGRPTALWSLRNPLILNKGPSFGVQTNGFGFIISWATNLSVVVEVNSHLANPTWTPLATNTLTSGWSYFSDPEWSIYPARFYRIRSL